MLQKAFLSYTNIAMPLGGYYIGLNTEYRKTMLDRTFRRSGDFFTFYEYLFKKIALIRFELFIKRLFLLNLLSAKNDGIIIGNSKIAKNLLN
jgi:hypothetical protein